MILQKIGQTDHVDPWGAVDVKGLADLENDHIVQMLQNSAWRIEGENGEGVLSGFNPSTLQDRMRKYGILCQ
jgi:hypothetical protein